MRYALAILDLDGTLADSLDALKAAYHSFLQEHGAKGSGDEFETLNGVPLAAIVDRLRTRHGMTDDPAEMLLRYAELVEIAQASTKPAAGAAEILQRSRSRGWRVAVVTSTPRKLAANWVGKSRLESLIDVVVGGDEVEHGKPSPEPYRLALSRLRCAALQSLAIEDSSLGAKAAVAAGIPTLALAHASAQGEWPSGVRFISCFADIADHL
jgi:HAD superfamily hydrolase (TIGR01509 family)